MKKIYESPFNGWDERAEMIIIYELEEGEYEEISALLEPDPDPDEAPEYLKYDPLDARDEFLENLGYFSDWSAGIMPGARYTRYYIERLTTHHLIISRWDALNV